VKTRKPGYSPTESKMLLLSKIVFVPSAYLVRPGRSWPARPLQAITCYKDSRV
jgi:hypothetical protein